MKPHFFFDNCMPYNLATMLATFFKDDGSLKKNDKDIPIIQTLAKRNPKPILISADVNMYTRVADERLALAGSGLTCVFFMKNTQNNNDIHDFASKVFKLWPDLVKTVTTVSQPTIFEINSGLRRVDKCCLTCDIHTWKRSK